MPSTARTAFSPISDAEQTFLGRLLRQETVGGAVVLVAAFVALVWANSGWVDPGWPQAYDDLRHLELGPLDLEHWAADGALVLFFYLAGLELKRELLVGSLRRPADALVPIVAAFGGVLVPAVLYTVVNRLAADGEPGGWAIPAATDIAFALAVLAVVGRHLPQQLRAFLLTLAVVDDLIVIVIIAAFYTAELHLVPLLVALGLLGVFALLQVVRGESWLWYIPLTLAIWWFTHESGVHATVAGVAMGLLTRVRTDPGEAASPAEHLEHLLTPVSAGIAVPFFALMSAGVTLDGGSSLLRDPVAIGVVLGLVVGKPVGVLGAAAATIRLTRAELGEGLGWLDLAGVAVLAGVGFTVALLVAELSFTGSQADVAKTAVLASSVMSAVVAAFLLHRRSRARAVGAAP